MKGDTIRKMPLIVCAMQFVPHPAHVGAGPRSHAPLGAGISPGRSPSDKAGRAVLAPNLFEMHNALS